MNNLRFRIDIDMKSDIFKRNPKIALFNFITRIGSRIVAGETGGIIRDTEHTVIGKFEFYEGTL